MCSDKMTKLWNYKGLLEFRVNSSIEDLHKGNENLVTNERRFKSWNWNLVNVLESELESQSELSQLYHGSDSGTCERNGNSIAMARQSTPKAMSWVFEAHFTQLDFIMVVYDGSEKTDLFITLSPANKEVFKVDYQGLSSVLVKLNLVPDPQSKVGLTRYVNIDVNNYEENELSSVDENSVVLASYRNFCSVTQLQQICQVMTVADNPEAESETEVFHFSCQISFTSDTWDGPVSPVNPKCRLRDMTPVSFEYHGRNLRRTSQYSDVSVSLLGHEENFREVFLAHKNILASMSPVFQQLFEANRKERTNSTDSNLVEDVSAKSVGVFLDTLYEFRGGFSKDLSEGMKDVSLALDVLKLADKYLVKEVRDYCIGSIVSLPDAAYSLKLVLLTFNAGILSDSRCLCVRATEWIKRHKGMLHTNEGKKLVDHFMKMYPETAGPFIRAIF